MKEPEQEAVVDKSEEIINADNLPIPQPVFECGDDASRSIAGNHYEQALEKKEVSEENAPDEDMPEAHENHVAQSVDEFRSAKDGLEESEVVA